MENYYSLSDIKSALGGEEGMGGGWFLIVILFLFLFGFGGMNGNRGCGPGYCGNDGYVTTSQFESENNFRTLDNSNRMTQNGLCQLGYEQANLINTSTAQIVGNITGEGRAIQSQLADCCCTTQRAIDSLSSRTARTHRRSWMQSPPTEWPRCRTRSISFRCRTHSAEWSAILWPPHGMREAILSADADAPAKKIPSCLNKGGKVQKRRIYDR